MSKNQSLDNQSSNKMNTSDVFWHYSSVSRQDREQANNHKAVLLWYTGLSGSGKSTIANSVDQMLHKLGCKSYVLDGDNIRHGLNLDLGFSDNDRTENIRRIGEVSKLFVDAGVIVSAAFITPFVSDRIDLRRKFFPGQFIEVFVDTPLKICEQRDPKGLYKKARSGKITDFTGIDSVYELPESVEIHLKTENLTEKQCAVQVIDYLRKNNYFSVD